VFEDFGNLFALNLTRGVLCASMQLNKSNQSWYSWLILSERAIVYLTLETSHFFPNSLAMPKNALVNSFLHVFTENKKGQIGPCVFG